MPRHAPTIVDVARKLNLGNSTVSEVLRGKPGYSDATRRRVLGAAKKLGYRPNYLGRALVGSASMTIGVFAGITETLPVANMVRAIEVASRDRGYLCYLMDWGNGDEARLLSHMQDLLDRRIDGLIIHQVMELPPSVEELVRQSSVPVVRFGRIPGDAKHAVRLERDRAMADLAAHLANLGHRRAALLASRFIMRNPGLKLTPFRKAFAAAGIELDTSDRWIMTPGREHDYGCLEVLKREIERGDLPSVVLLNSDAYALEAYAAMHDAGLSVPRDLSIVGFNDDTSAAVMRPALTTIRQPRGEIGEAAFNMLLQLMTDPNASVEDQVFQCELVVRDSTGPVSSRHV